MKFVPANGPRCDTIAPAAAAVLEVTGYKQQLKRKFSMMSMLGLAFAVLNTWTALAASISLALPSGGSSAGTCNLCLAASLTEFLSAYPAAGGQYHWVSIISRTASSRAISYTTGWINVCGWAALSASGPSSAAPL
ncbi:hypothetical protein E4U54_000854 [Claviceps lovelessii]|nr:hypothetical protein E4U54_000854 [Claviceps lovelessii]